VTSISQVEVEKAIMVHVSDEPFKDHY